MSARGCTTTLSESKHKPGARAPRRPRESHTRLGSAPRAREAAPAAPPEAAPETGVLVLDDEARLRRSITVVADSVECRVWEAADIESAKGLLAREGGIRGLCIDVGLGAESGIDFLLWARRDLGCELPALVLTGASQQDLPINPGALRAVYLQKPAQIHDLSRFLLAARNGDAIRRDVAAFAAAHQLGDDHRKLLEFAWYMSRGELSRALAASPSKTDKLASEVCQRLSIIRLDQYFRHHALWAYGRPASGGRVSLVAARQAAEVHQDGGVGGGEGVEAPGREAEQ